VWGRGSLDGVDQEGVGRERMVVAIGDGDSSDRMRICELEVEGCVRSYEMSRGDVAGRGARMCREWARQEEYRQFGSASRCSFVVAICEITLIESAQLQCPTLPLLHSSSAAT
jgi:hypothetical protein